MANRWQERLNRASAMDGGAADDGVVESGHENDSLSGDDPPLRRMTDQAGVVRPTSVSAGQREAYSSDIEAAPPPVEVVRLSVNLLPESATTLKALCRRNTLNLTEGDKAGYSALEDRR